MINFLVLATAQPMERTPNIAENEIKQNHDDVGTGDTSGTYSKQSWYPHHRHFVLFQFRAYLAFFFFGCVVASTKKYIIY